MSETVQEIIQQIQRLPKEDRAALDFYLAQASACGRGEAESPPRDIEAWSRELRRWAESHEKRDIVIDDSRETIYEGCGE